MATTSAATMALLQVTLCLLLVLAAQGKDDSTDVVLVVSGIARCKRNCSRIISDAPLHLLIDNNTITGTGRTTSTGKVVMTVKLTSREVASLMSNDSSKAAFLVAPPHACGESNLPPGMIVAAPVRPVAAISASGQLLLPFNGTLYATTNISLNAQMPTIASSDGSIKMIVAHVTDGFACLVTLIGSLIPRR